MNPDYREMDDQDKFDQIRDKIVPILEEITEGDFILASGAMITLSAAFCSIMDSSLGSKNLRRHLKLFRAIYAKPVPQ